MAMGGRKGDVESVEKFAISQQTESLPSIIKM